MTLVNEVSANDLIPKVAEELKKLDEMQPPKWAAFCKTGMHRERPPTDDDWWYVRAAAILRTVALRGPIGVSKLMQSKKKEKNFLDTFFNFLPILCL